MDNHAKQSVIDVSILTLKVAHPNCVVATVVETEMAEQQTAEMFTVSLKGTGVVIEREVNAAQLALIMSVLMGGDASGPISEEKPRAIGGSVKVSLREFLDDAKAITKPDQIVAIGHYMALQESRETFSREDIKARFQSAREKLPANFPRDFNAAIAKAMIAEDHAKRGQYYVTKTGVQAVERRFGS